MATDIFAKIGDVKGESMDSKHKDEIEVLSWSWGLTNAGSMGSGSGGGTGKVSFQDFSFMHHVDKATPVLLANCADGAHFKDATITARKAGKGQQEFLVFKFDTVYITGVQSGAGGDVPTENVTMQFAKVSVEYKPQKPDGSLDAGIFFKYDVKGSKAG